MPDSAPTTYVIFIDDNFHYQDESYRRRLPREFATAAQAIAVARRIVESSVDEHYQPGMSAEKLVAAYRQFGEDPFIIGPEHVEFSAWDYAATVAKWRAGAA
jgi:hypothetical protein